MQQAIFKPQNINFKKERNFSEKINATFAFLSQNFKPIAKNLVLIAGPFALLAGMSYGFYQSTIFGSAFTQQIPVNGSFLAPSILISLFGIVLFSLIAGGMVTAVVFRHVKVYVEEGHSTISTTFLWSTIWKEFFSVIGTSLYIWLGIFVIGMIIFLPVGILGAATMSPAFMAIIIMGLMIAMMFIMPAFMLLYPIRSIEKKGVFSATSRMFKIISGKWLSTLGIVLVSVIILSIISIVFSVPMYITMFMQMLHSQEAVTLGQEPGSLYQILFSISAGISMLGTYILYSILIIAITFQYYSLVERKDASGLLERMENFGKQKPDLEDYAEQY